MLLNQNAEYSLRAVAILGALEPGTRMTARELADVANLPPSYASKVLRKLVVAGLVDALRGHHGGFRLAREPETIRIIEVLDAAGFNIRANECAFGIGDCNEQNPCALHPAYTELRATFEDWARSTHVGCGPDGQAAGSSRS